MKRYRFNDGHEITSKLEPNEILNRMNRLDWLRVITEEYEEGTGYEICKKALKAYDKVDNFTGIIRLTITEKDFLGYMLEENNDKRTIEVINYYIR